MTKSIPLPAARAKTATGIIGLDEALRGGLPCGRVTVILGGPGSGKTILGLQALVNGARNSGEPGIFVAFEENTDAVMANASSFGWDLPALQESNKLCFLDARTDVEFLKSGEFDLSALLAIVAAKAREIGARRVVFDAIDMLLCHLENPAAERREILRLHNWLHDSGLTGVVSAKANRNGPEQGSPFAGIHYMADCVLALGHEMVNRVSMRSIHVIKYRGSGFAENEISMTIGDSGIEVVATKGFKGDMPASRERISTGVEQLDAMLGGGYYKGSGILITGAPGTSKSTLAAAFAEDTCKQGKRALYVSFDENQAALVRNFESVGIDLTPHIESKQLRIHSILAESSSPNAHYTVIRNLILEHRPDCMVIDPLSALTKSGPEDIAEVVAEQLIQFTKSCGITILNTSLLSTPNQEVEASHLRISTIADTWIHLSYVVLSGERNRALTIVKSRGMKHSNQVRELILSDDGITLTYPYTAEGEVLMGTLRWQKEQAERNAKARDQTENEHARLAIELESEHIHARMELLKRELAIKQAELQNLAQTHSDKESSDSEHLATIMARRGNDTDNPPEPQG